MSSEGGGKLGSADRLPLFANDFQQRSLWFGKLGDPFGHQGSMQMIDIDGGVDFVLNRLAGHLLEGWRKPLVAGRDRLVGFGRIGLNVAAGERLDIFPRWQARIFHAGARENQFLIQFQTLVAPELTVFGPDAFGI